MRHLIVLLLMMLVSFSGLSGDGKYVKRYTLEEIDPIVGGQPIEVIEPTFTGQDSKNYFSYTGYVFLDYGRQHQSDRDIWQTDWRCTLGYTDGNNQSGTIVLSSIDGIYEGLQIVYNNIFPFSAVVIDKRLVDK